MATLNESVHAAEFLLSEANGTRSRESVTIESGQDLSAGAVLGKVTASGEYKEYNPGNADGSETAVAVLYDDCDASAAAKSATVIFRDAEVRASSLQWFSGATTNQKTTGKTELANVGIIAR